MFLSAGCSLLRDKGFFCSLDVLYEGLGIGKLHFLMAPDQMNTDPIHCFKNRIRNLIVFVPAAVPLLTLWTYIAGASCTRS